MHSLLCKKSRHLKYALLRFLRNRILVFPTWNWKRKVFLKGSCISYPKKWRWPEKIAQKNSPFVEESLSSPIINTNRMGNEKMYLKCTTTDWNNYSKDWSHEQREDSIYGFALIGGIVWGDQSEGYFAGSDSDAGEFAQWDGMSWQGSGIQECWYTQEAKGFLIIGMLASRRCLPIFSRCGNFL